MRSLETNSASDHSAKTYSHRRRETKEMFALDVTTEIKEQTPSGSNINLSVSNGSVAPDSVRCLQKHITRAHLFNEYCLIKYVLRIFFRIFRTESPYGALHSAILGVEVETYIQIIQKTTRAIKN